jgi:hypothetical protein
MPPQQPDRPLDILDDGLRFRAHSGLRRQSVFKRSGNPVRVKKTHQNKAKSIFAIQGNAKMLWCRRM